MGAGRAAPAGLPPAERRTFTAAYERVLEAAPDEVAQVDAMLKHTLRERGAGPGGRDREAAGVAARHGS